MTAVSVKGYTYIAAQCSDAIAAAADAAAETAAE